MQNFFEKSVFLYKKTIGKTNSFLYQFGYTMRCDLDWERSRPETILDPREKTMNTSNKTATTDSQQEALRQRKCRKVPVPCNSDPSVCPPAEPRRGTSNLVSVQACTADSGACKARFKFARGRFEPGERNLPRRRQAPKKRITARDKPRGDFSRLGKLTLLSSQKGVRFSLIQKGKRASSSRLNCIPLKEVLERLTDSARF